MEKTAMEGSNGRLVTLLSQVPRERLAPLFERHGIPPSESVKTLVEEIRLDGSNTIASVVRGREGVQYLEIVRDVANKLGAGYKPDTDEVEIEYAILAKVLQVYLKNASQEERKEVDQILRKVAKDHRNASGSAILAAIAAGSLALLIKQVGKKVVAGIVMEIVARIAARQAAKEGAKIAARAAGYAIPLLNAVMIVWTVVDIAGPAFRKTVPTVIEIALLRLEYGKGEE